MKRDLLIIVDATGSMGSFLRSLTTSLFHVLSVANLTQVFERFRVVAYHDHCDPKVTNWSSFSSSNDLDTLINFVKQLVPSGGGDAPEAIKYTLGELIVQLNDAVDKDRATFALIITDAPPHHHATGSSNIDSEKKKMKEMGVPFDWVQLSRRLKELNVTVNCILSREYTFYPFISQCTGGQTVTVPIVSVSEISRATINFILGWIGAESNMERCKLVEFDRDLSNVVDENDQIFTNILMKLTADPVIKPITGLVTPLYPLLKKFESDEEYSNLVFKTFNKLMENPTDVLALTYNSVLGSFWRLICKRRTDDRRERLLESINLCMSKLKGEELERVKAWLSESYNQTNVVLEANRKLEAENKTRYPIFVSENSSRFTSQQVLEIARSCSPEILAKVGELLTGLRLVHGPPKGTVEVVRPEEIGEDEEEEKFLYVCEGLNDNQLFSFLPHLIAKGTVFSTRPSWIMAALAIMTNNSLLKERADRFMKSVKGKWFDPEVPENYTFQFAKFVRNLPNKDDYLTVEEQEAFKKIFDVSNFQSNFATELNVIQTVSPSKAVMSDVKRECNKCHNKRSFTLLLNDGSCGLCNNLDVVDCGINNPETLGDDQSYYAECRTCKVHYAIVRVGELNVSPKCHFCRKLNSPPPSITCVKCTDSYLLQNDAFGFNREDFCCPRCENDPSSAFLESKLSAMTLIEDNQKNREIFFGCIGINFKTKNINEFNLRNYITPFKLKDEVVLEEPKSFEGVQLTFKGKLVINSEEVLKSFKEWVNSGTFETSNCLLCFETFPRGNLHVVCGRENCQTLACVGCLRGWYGSTKPGGILLPPRLSCPFCKRYPKGSVLSKYNQLACGLPRTFEELDPQWYHAWCASCYIPKPYVEHECARDVPETKEIFTCSECVDRKRTRLALLEEKDEAKAAKLREELRNFPEWESARNCPSCEMSVIKESGCNHITCCCGIHWCYSCSTEFPLDVIYDHIYECQVET